MIAALWILAILAVRCFVTALVPTPDRDDPVWGDDDG